MAMNPLQSSWLLLLSFVIPFLNADIGPDGLCPLFVFVPFTNNGTASVSISGENGGTNPGFAHMGAALLAMEHFNNRDASVVPELTDLTDGCNVSFDFGRTRFFDTGTVGHLAAKSMYQQKEDPCAIAGPFNTIPAVDLAVLAEAAEVPLVAHRAMNIRVVLQEAGRYSSQVFPDIYSDTFRLIQYLVERGRYNYMTILYPSTELGVQYRETIANIFDLYGMETFSQGFQTPDSNEDEERYGGFLESLQRVKDRGFRTIVVPLDRTKKELIQLANVADALGMTQGNDYFWMWFGSFDLALLFQEAPKNDNLRRLLFGSAWITAIDPMFLADDLGKDQHPFEASIRSRGKNFVEQAMAASPIPRGQPGYIDAGPHYFKNHTHLEFGQAFMYDAVMTIGIGACLAQRQREPSTLASAEHVQGIRSINMTGASGVLRFYAEDGEDEIPGARWPEGPTWVGLNLLPSPDHDYPFDLVDVILEGGTEWRPLPEKTFIFPGGTSEAPPLRNTPNENYLFEPLRILGFCLLGFVLVSALASVIWVYANHSHRVLAAAQPFFLYLLAFGSSVFASSIVTLSFDESHSWTTAQLDIACNCTPWLFSLGYMITYGALFSKLYRVNRVLQFTRQRGGVSVRRSVLPAAVFFLLTLVVLILWSTLDRLRWERVILNDYTGESIGQCVSHNVFAFVVPLALLMAVLMLLTAWMAWKTRDVDDAYAESKWIFVLIVVQLEITVLGLPVIAILRTLSTNGRFVGFAIIIWTFPMSTLVLVMLPKWISFRRAVYGDERPEFKRGQRTSTRVSGMMPDSSTASVYNNNNRSHQQQSDSL